MKLTAFQKIYLTAKRGFDIAASLAGLIILSPMLLILSLWVIIDDGFPIFFTQKRVGKSKPDGSKTYFKIYKFRTMKKDTPHDMPTHLLSDPEQYLTKSGKWLRKTSMDEIPQLFNILNGDMSVIGPRPALWNQYDLLEERDKYHANDIRPGLTGWAQVNGRDELEIDVKAKLDGYYVEHMGPVMDIRCFLKTVSSVLKSEGVVEGGTGELHKEKTILETEIEKKPNAKKVILVANVAKEHILKFHVPTIKMLKEEGWHVDVACSGDEEVPYCDQQFHMIYKRNPFSIKTILGVFQLRKILKKETYDILSCHTPTGGVVARLATIGLKNRPYVIYTAHGFHFFKGAPLVNWLVFFPIEWVLGHFTDELVVINREDYKNAKKLKLGMKKLTLIKGMGVNKERFSVRLSEEEKEKLKKEFKIPKDEFVYTYVAEVLANKNQQVLLKALKKVREKTGKGILVLVGPIHDDGECQKLAKELGISKYVRFTGWRSDIERIYNITDVCVASSIREGLGLNLIEAQYSDVPVIASNNRGHRDVVKNGLNGIIVRHTDVEGFVNAMERLMKSKELREKYITNSRRTSMMFEQASCLKQIGNVYMEEKR